MLNKLSEENRTLIFIEFVKEILMHSGNADLLNLKNMVAEEQKEQKKQFGIKENVKKILSEDNSILNHQKNNLISPLPIVVPQRAITPLKIRTKPRVLRIPQPRIPASLNIMPTATKMNIDLHKLNPLINDPQVREISCSGPGEKIVVMVPSPKETPIILSKEEISEIVNIFEKNSKIPSTEGLYNVVVGRLSFSAIISEVLGSKFVIKKLAYSPMFR